MPDFFDDISLNWSLNATVGPDGLLYVGEYNGNSDRIHKFDPATGAYLGVFVASKSAGLDGPAGMEFGPDGNLYVASNFSQEILRFDGLTGAPIGTGPLAGKFVTAGSGGLNEPDDITFGPDGDLYVTSFNTDQVLRYDGMTGEFKEVFIEADPSKLDKPSELVFGPDGNLYVTSVGTNQVVRYLADGAFDRVFTSGVTMNEPRGAVFGPDGDLYVADIDAIRRFDGTTGIYTGGTLASSPDVDWPTQFTFLPSQQVLVNPINDAPVVSAPGSALAATEQTNLSIEGVGIGVDDVDAGMGTATATLAVGEGVLTVVVGDSGVAIDSGDGTGNVVLSGRVSDLDKLLIGNSTGTITYYNGSDTPSASTTLSVTVDDGGDTGADPGDSGTPTSESGSNSVTINIVATNDPAIIGGVDTGSLTEDSGAVGGYLDAGGGLTATDPDNPDDTFTAATHRGALGKLTIDGSGTWSYSVDNSLPGIQALAAGATVDDVITVTSIDGTTHDITITITGNAAPTAQDDLSYTIDEDGVLTADWWDTDWTHRSTITLDNSGQTETLTDFPVLVVLNSGNINYALTQSDGADLRFFDADGNALAYDIEEWNASGDSYVWVKVPQIGGGDVTDITMYWGNATATSAENASAVWSNGYTAVHHLHDDFNDATVQRNTAINSGSTDTAGRVGDGQLFDGSDDLLSLGADPSLHDLFNGGGTVSAWVYVEDWGQNGYGRIFDKSGDLTPSTTGWALELFGSQQALLFQVGFSGGVGQWATVNSSVSEDAWNHVSLNYDSSDPSNVPEIYVNGTLQLLNGSYTNQPGALETAGDDSGYDLRVGGFSTVPVDTRSFDGVIDNVQISSTARSVDWIQAQYLATSGTFASVGDAESIGTSTAGVLDNDTTVDPHTPRATSLDTTGTLGLVTLNEDGTFTYDTNSQFDYLADGDDTTDTFSYTLDDGVNPPTVATVTITVTGTNDAPVARPDGVHLSFDGTDYVRVADDASLQVTGSNTVTMEAWINHDGTGTGSQLIVNKEGEYELGITADTGEIKFAIALPGNTWSWHNTGHFVTAGEWTHVAVSFDGSFARTYINGQLVDEFAQAGPIGEVYPTYDSLTIGGRENATDQRFTGQIDEVRVWRDARTQGEIQGAMNGLLAGTEPDLAGYWRLDEFASGTVVDYSGNGNDGVFGSGLEAPVYQGYATNQDSVLSIVAGSGVLANDSDADGDSLVVSAVNGNAGDVGSQIALGSGALLTLNGDGSYVYDPNGAFDALDAGEQATDTFRYTVSDGSLDSGEVTVTIIITGVNDSPTTAGLSNVTVDEDAPATVVDLHATFADLEDADTAFVYTIENNTNTALFTSTAIAGGNLTLDYAADVSGSADITVRATDTGGLWVESAFTVTVNAVNDEPTLTLGGNQSVGYESGAHTVGGFASALPGGGADEAGQTFIYNVSNDNNALFSVQPTINA
ncbi:MAG: DUF2341 domain-containing protein, partial [Chromatiaceae bacterium]